MTGTRSFISVSWQRSRQSQVDTAKLEPGYFDEIDGDCFLLRAARPVFCALAEELANEPVCLVLTDSRGVVLLRAGGDGELRRALNTVQLAPGYCYSESDVGTNGIGTALEVGGPIQIDGREHYSDALTQFSCAGALVTHPVTGTLLGVVDITTKATNSNPLLLAFAKLAAHRLAGRILEMASELDVALLGDYYTVSRRSGVPVIAVGNDVSMLNSLAQQQFAPADQTALLDQTRAAMGRVDPCTTLLDLPSGASVRLAYQPTFAGDALAGGIMRVNSQFTPPTHCDDRRPTLPGLAGTSPTWRRVSHEIRAAASASEWLLVQGEPGVGKRSLITAAHTATSRERRLSITDTRSCDDLLDRIGYDLRSGNDVAIHHADLLSGEQLDDLASLMTVAQDHAEGHIPWVALTTDTDKSADVEAHLLRLVPRTVFVPPLRHHVEDIPALVRFLLNRDGVANLRLSKSAMSQLMRLPWPGNISQLHRNLRDLCRTRRSGKVDWSDLPAECLAAGRRILTRLETLERDAVIEALTTHGDKSAAAESLGISRATIYRRVRKYGITT